MSSKSSSSVISVDSANTKRRSSDGLSIVRDWMKLKDRNPFPFQRATWKAIAAGESGLLHSPTGTGKTLAVWLGAIADWINQQPGISEWNQPKSGSRQAVPIQVLWITPLRALAADTLSALEEPIKELKLPWTVERRTSDTSSSVKARQKSRLPSCLVTTPESLSLLLSYPQTAEQLSTLKLIVVDEWHELMGTKRGVQTELGLSRLRSLSPQVMTWAVSATIGNVEEALSTAVGRPLAAYADSPNSASADRTGSGPDLAFHATKNAKRTIIRAPQQRKLSVRSLIPQKMDLFPWAGHLGLKSMESVLEALDSAGSSLLFTNTRSQAERWYAALLQARPNWAGQLGLHHGSLDQDKRKWVEQELDAGRLKCVVCTSSLDLGVDFFPVEQVLQVGSPKGIARLMQRAGRSGHYPGGKSQLVFVPTHALELIELAAAKESLKRKQIESRVPLTGCLDVLAQHVVTLAAGAQVDPQQILAEVRQTHAFQDLDEAQWEWVMDFVQRGGDSLKAYPDFRKVVATEAGISIADPNMAKRHRMSIGTISSDQEVLVKFLKGGRLGTIEERFVSKLKPGDKFTFAGRTLKLVMFRDMTAWVRKSTGKVAAVPRWMGGHLPLSSELAKSVRDRLGEASRGEFRGPEMRACRPLLDLQAAWSCVPDEDTLLIEQVKTREGFHLFFFPFEGRLVHEGLAALLAWRISRLQPITFATTVNDYGVELLSPTEPLLEQALKKDLLSPAGLLPQIEKSMNATELDRRQFRDIARIAGLVGKGLPGQGKSSRQLQASSDLFFDVFKEFDPENLLLKQSRREVLSQQLEHQRLESALQRLATGDVVIRHPPKPTPLAFPILVDRLRSRLSSERLEDRIQRMTQQFEKLAARPEKRSQK